MRGTHLLCKGWNTGHGIIPAYAGNTRPTFRSISYIGDHPRVCGEHRLPAITTNPTSGSSPRMRGTLLVTFRPFRQRGIIPAYAGNTPTRRLPPRDCRDHPRVCGEHIKLVHLRHIPQGSSPRMRGTRVHKFRQLLELGIIPAYAGNTTGLIFF